MFEIIELQKGEFLEKGMGTIIHETEREFSIYDVIHLNDVFYIVACLHENQVGVRKFFPLEDDKLFNKNQLVCPLCGYEDNDSWELDDEGTNDCANCGAELKYKRQVEVTYNIELKNKPNIIRL